MAKDPAFLFYTGDFSTGTQFFTNEQVGKYLRLLMAQHQLGHLSEKHMLIICETRDEDIFKKFAQDDQGLYFNERLESEIIRRRTYSESRSNNRKKPNISKSYDSTYVQHMENENEIETKKETKGKKEKKPIVEVSIFEGSIWDNTEMNNAWAKWIKYKKVEFRDTYKSKEYEKQAGRHLWKIAEGKQLTAIKIIEDSIAKHYKGLFELKENGKIEQPTTRLGENSHDGKEYKL